MQHGLKSAKVAGIAGAVLGLASVWIGFQLATHGHTGILRTLAQSKRLLAGGSASPHERPKHHVTLTWKASTSPHTRYNVYRRGVSDGLARLNAAPIVETSYPDDKVLAGQTYFYTTRAVSLAGVESGPSNEVRVDVPSP